MDDPPERRLLRLLVAFLLLGLAAEETAGSIPEVWSDSTEAHAVARHRGARLIAGHAFPEIPDLGLSLPPIAQVSEAPLRISSRGSPAPLRVFPRTVAIPPERTRAPPS